MSLSASPLHMAYATRQNFLIIEAAYLCNDREVPKLCTGEWLSRPRNVDATLRALLEAGGLRSDQDAFVRSVSRAQLCAYAEAAGVRPAFLFPRHAPPEKLAEPTVSKGGAERLWSREDAERRINSLAAETPRRTDRNIAQIMLAEYREEYLSKVGKCPGDVEVKDWKGKIPSEAWVRQQIAVVRSRPMPL